MSPIYAKTALGQKEIQDRSVGLGLLERRLLLLMNGQRRLTELTELMPGQDLQPLIQSLLDKGCRLFMRFRVLAGRAGRSRILGCLAA